MGVQHRDYMRDRPAFGDGGVDDPEAGLGGGRPWGTWIICALIFVLWLLFAGSYSESDGRLNEFGVFVYDVLLLHPAEMTGTGRVWQLATASWFHNPNGIAHVGWNLVLLFFFGRTVERAFGTGRILRMVIVSAIVWAGVTVVMELIGLRIPSVVFGASGMVCALGAATAFIGGRGYALVFGRMVRRDAIAWAAVVLTVTVHPTLATRDGMVMIGMVIAHACAVLYGWLDARSIPRAAAYPLGEIAPDPPSGSPRERVDALLERISADGIESLSDEERAFLEDASKRYS